MNASVRLKDGNAVELPTPIAWEISRSDGETEESFRYRFPYESGWRTTLADAVRFYARQDGANVFCGVVDGFTLTLDGNGRSAICADAAWRDFLRTTSIPRATRHRSAVRS